jgi:hypothetical protein
MDTYPTSVTEVKQLSAKKLNSICLEFGVDKQLPKSVKINATCHCLGISTTGSDSVPFALPHVAVDDNQLNEFKALSPGFLYGAHGWSTNLQHVPVIDDSMVKQYLLKMEFLDELSLRSYKLTRPYQQKSSVHSIRHNELPSSSFCIIRAMCNPSQSTSCDDVKLIHIILDKNTGSPLGAYCTCTIGFVKIICMISNV